MNDDTPTTANDDPKAASRAPLGRRNKVQVNATLSSPTTRVWLNNEEITHLVTSVTVERWEGERTRIGFNGSDPVVRDNVRVEVEQGGATYVIDETQAAREAPLPRLATGPLRDPLSRADRRDYWTAEP